MPTLVKLSVAGESVTMKVASCEKNTVGTYPGMLWTGKDTRGNIITIEIPASSSERQLKRLELTPATIVGRTVVISRDPNATNPAKPWWGVNLANVGEAVEDVPTEDMTETGAPPAPQVPKPATAPPASPALMTRYLLLVDQVAAHLRAQNKADFNDYATAQPIAATIWITMQNKGLV